MSHRQHLHPTLARLAETGEAWRDGRPIRTPGAPRTDEQIVWESVLAWLAARCPVFAPAPDRPEALTLPHGIAPALQVVLDAARERGVDEALCDLAARDAVALATEAAVPWALLERLSRVNPVHASCTSECVASGGRIRHAPACGFTAREEARLALAARPEQPPESLARANIDGWAMLGFTFGRVLVLDVWDGDPSGQTGGWRSWSTSGWRVIGHKARPAPWHHLTPEQHAAILTVWAEVDTWHRAGRPDSLAPWRRDCRFFEGYP